MSMKDVIDLRGRHLNDRLELSINQQEFFKLQGNGSNKFTLLRAPNDRVVQ
jgi:hypothetical protein